MVRTGKLDNVDLRDLPLNAELDAEGTCGKFAECIRDDPKWDEKSDEKDKDAENQRVEINPGEIRRQE